MDRAGEVLATIGSVLALCASPSAGERGSGLVWVAMAQATLDKAARQIADVADEQDGLRITNLSPAVEQFVLQRAILRRGSSHDVMVDVVESGQHGALYLNFGGGSIDLSPPHNALVIEVAGPEGARTLSFSSGVTMGQIAGTIRLFSKATGTTAREEVSGVTVQSTRLGDAPFVRVRVIADGGLQAVGAGVGIYRMMAGDANRPDPSSRVGLNTIQAAHGVQDHGQDVRGIVDAWEITGQGSWVWVNRPRLRLFVRLSDGPLGAGMTANAQNLGTFRAMTIVRDP